MSIFVLVLCKMSENSKKILNNYDILDEDIDFDQIDPFWPVFGQLKPWCKCQKLSMSSFTLVLIRFYVLD